MSAFKVMFFFYLLLDYTAIICVHKHGTGVKVSVKEDSDVVLPCSLSNKQDITAAAFDWKKVAQNDEDQKEVFFYNEAVHYNNGRDGQSKEFKGRVSHFQDQLNHGNASIIIKDTKMADSGNYTCFFPRLQPPQTLYIELVVVAAPEPYIRRLHATEVWSLLQCEVRGASPQPAVEWQDGDGNKLPAEEPQVSQRGGSYDITVNITVNKTDRYRCVVEQEDIKHRVTSETFVLISGATPKPYIETLHATEVWSLLQCEVRGASPKSKVEWQDSDGNKLPAEEPQVSQRGGSYDITLNITVNKTDRYRCVVEQEDIKHRVTSETFVLICEKVCKDWIGWLGGFVLGAVLSVALPVFGKWIPIRRKRSFDEEMKVNQFDGHPMGHPDEMKELRKEMEPH